MKVSAAPWLGAYQAAYWRPDLVAGLTVAAVVIPQAMAYAAVAGLPVQVGLYCSLAAMLVYPLLGGSRPLSVTTTSAIAMLTAAEVTSASGQAPPVAIAATLAFLVGGALLAARLLKLGFLANFISKPVLVGFQAGVGVAIIVGQLKNVMGVRVASHSTIGILMELPGTLTQGSGLTALVAVIGVLFLFAVPRLVPRLPAPLIWVGSSIVAAVAFGLATRGVASIGTVPAGLPTPALPDLSLAAALWPGALGIALMSFTESTAAARTFQARSDPPVNANRELVAIGAANLAAAVVGGMPAGGGASQTAVADSAGARTQMAQWINAGAVLVTLLFASGAISLMPKPALAAVIVVTGVSMIKPATFFAIAQVRRDDLAWALATVAGVILVGTLNGILVAVVISLLTLFYQANHPPVYALVYDSSEDVFRRAGPRETDQAFPGLLILGTEGRITFANAQRVGDKMQALIEAAQPKVVVLECTAIPDIEYTALLMLIEAERNLRARGVTLWLAAVNPHLSTIIERSPLAAALGPDRVFTSRRQAIQAWKSGPLAAADLAAPIANSDGPNADSQ